MNASLTPRPGLTASEAAERLAADGPNELPRIDRRSLRKIMVDVLREPMLALLLAGGLEPRTKPRLQRRGDSCSRVMPTQDAGSGVVPE